MQKCPLLLHYDKRYSTDDMLLWIKSGMSKQYGSGVTIMVVGVKMIAAYSIHIPSSESFRTVCP